MNNTTDYKNNVIRTEDVWDEDEWDLGNLGCLGCALVSPRLRAGIHNKFSLF